MSLNVLSMTAARHRTQNSAFKGILILIGLALFIVQLSDKFYLYANKPFIQVSGKNGKREVFLIVRSGIFNNSYFSPGRRYQSENCFALPTPGFFQGNWRVWHKIGFYTVNETAVCSTFPVTAVRGPPDQ
jgi:hypothetical protein